MEINKVYQEIQQIVELRPLLVVGSGASVDHKIPGMADLRDHLLANVIPNFPSEKNLLEFKGRLSEGKGLEQALAGINLKDDILDEVKRKTWELISERDLDLFERIITGHKILPIAKLLRHIFKADPQIVDVITTNYDRIIEYACDQVKLPASLGFGGVYSKYFHEEFPSRHSVNILKVHGSLDMFRDANGDSVSIPMCHKITPGLTPEIIVPGDAKYREILRGTLRSLLSEADKRINKASAFLCIGYGFNDNQIQEYILKRVRQEVPIIVLTRTVSDIGRLLLKQYAERYVCIEKDSYSNSTNISLKTRDNEQTMLLEGKMLWTIDGFMSIIT